MRVCVISQYFPPDVGGASTRADNIVKTLVSLGHETTVITGFPHYPQGLVPQEYRGHFITIESTNRARVVRVWMPPIPHEGTTKRLLMYMIFAFSAMMAWPYFLRTKVTWAVSPNYLSMIPATACKMVSGTRVIHDVVDIWPEALVATGYSFSRLILMFAGIVSRVTYAISDTIVTISESMAEDLRKTVSAKTPVTIVENCVGEQFFAIAPPQANLPLHMMYLGTLGPSNDFTTLLESAVKLRNQDIAEFTIAGSGDRSRAIAETIQNQKVTNVTFRGQAVPHGLGNTSLPSKLGDYLAAARPIICTADGNLADMIRDNRIALLVSPGDVIGFTGAIMQLSQDKGLYQQLSARGRQYAHDHMSYESFYRKINDTIGAVGVTFDRRNSGGLN